MTDCLFCRMVAGEIKPDVVLDTPSVLAFRDIRPQAPVHVLVIPKLHIPTLDDMVNAEPELAAELFGAASKVAEIEGISASGYRTVINCRGDSGQEVFHLHLHVLGGRRLVWPPG